MLTNSSGFLVFKHKGKDFPGGPVVRTVPSSAEGAGSIPGRGAGFLHALGPKNQNIKNKGSVVTSSIKTLKNGPHQKKPLKNKGRLYLPEPLKLGITI